jgi:DNA-binding response OmpR family regulator
MNNLWKTILIVDDTQTILVSIRHMLEQVGYEVRTAQTGKEGLMVIQKFGLPSLAIVDINMPEMDGFTFCTKLHSFSDVPVILLTSIDDEKTVVKGLREHAEDYITKPFRNAELLARIERVLGRLEEPSHKEGAFSLVETRIDDRLTMNLPQKYLLLAGEKIFITPQETKFLHILLKHHGKTVSTPFLLQRLWPGEEAFEERLHTLVYRLRKKVEENPKQPRYILADWGRGYSLYTENE